MSGVPDQNFPAFFCAEALLELWGYEIVNPARLDIEDGRAVFNANTGGVILDNTFTAEKALHRDFLEILSECKFIVVLPDWIDSPNGQYEVALGKKIGLPVFPFNAHKPLNIDQDKPLEVETNVSCRIIGQDGPRQNHRSEIPGYAI
jgi:hypothetical protein